MIHRKPPVCCLCLALGMENGHVDIATEGIMNALSVCSYADFS